MVDESPFMTGRSPEDAVLGAAHAKAIAVGSGRGEIVIAGDTVVVTASSADGIQQRTVLGKPTDRRDAATMLRSFSGAQIETVTGISVAGTCRVVTTRVTLRTMHDEEIATYLASGAGDDKAGGLELQDRAAAFIDTIDGCWTNVVGLPLCAVDELVAESLATPRRWICERCRQLRAD